MAVPPPLPADIVDKPALRRRLRAARSAFVGSLDGVALGQATAAIAARLATIATMDGPIGGYAAHRGEPDVAAALSAWHRLGRTLALPRVEDGAMRFVPWRPGAATAPGFAGIAEPPDGPGIVPATLIVPLLGFDRRGTRLGQGAGCYDRWLAAHPGARTIGVAWSVQEEAVLPRDPWDVPLDLVVTEKETIAP